MKTDETTSKLVSTRLYKGFSLAEVTPRVNSSQIFENPSRYGNNLKYPDVKHTDKESGHGNKKLD